MAHPITTTSLVLCQICHNSQFKYRCPGCAVQTCSLACVKSHKLKNNCDGKRKLTEFVKLDKFNYRNLTDDISFLESSARKIARAQGPVLSQSLPQTQTANQSVMCSRHVIGKLKRAASFRKINLKLAPFMTTRRRQNSTHCNASNPNNVSKATKMFWHLKWVCADVQFEETKVNENMVIRHLIQRLLYSTENDRKLDEESINRLALFRSTVKSEYGDTDTLISDPCVAMEAEHLNKSNSYYSFDLDKSLRDNLTGKTIVEYPVIHILPKQQTEAYNFV